MEFIYGTGNPAKVAAAKKRFETLGIRITGYRELGRELPAVAEDGKTPLENARKKALRYYRELGRPVFSCDSGLYIDGLPDELQPGVHVRTVRGHYLSDEEMVAYYSGLARQYGTLTARYRNAICLVMDERRIYERMDESLESEPFRIVSKPHLRRNPGFPLDSISVNPKTGRYYYDEEESRLEQVALEDGFLDFFAHVLAVEEAGRASVQVHFYEDGVTDEKLAFAVIAVRTEEKWVFCRHKDRSTFEMPGGHREKGETILEAAKRELWEETGADRYTIRPLCVYSVEKTDEKGKRSEDFGMLFYAEAEHFSPLTHEIEELWITSEENADWTYPLILPHLLEKAKKMIKKI